MCRAVESVVHSGPCYFGGDGSCLPWSAVNGCNNCHSAMYLLFQAKTMLCGCYDHFNATRVYSINTIHYYVWLANCCSDTFNAVYSINTIHYYVWFVNY